jgi:hypothetical protein
MQAMTTPTFDQAVSDDRGQSAIPGLAVCSACGAAVPWASTTQHVSWHQQALTRERLAQIFDAMIEAGDAGVPPG